MATSSDSLHSHPLLPFRLLSVSAAWCYDDSAQTSCRSCLYASSSCVWCPSTKQCQWHNEYCSASTFNTNDQCAAVDTAQYLEWSEVRGEAIAGLVLACVGWFIILVGQCKCCCKSSAVEETAPSDRWMMSAMKAHPIQWSLKVPLCSFVAFVLCLAALAADQWSQYTLDGFSFRTWMGVVALRNSAYEERANYAEFCDAKVSGAYCTIFQLGGIGTLLPGIFFLLFNLYIFIVRFNRCSPHRHLMLPTVAFLAVVSGLCCLFLWGLLFHPTMDDYLATEVSSGYSFSLYASFWVMLVALLFSAMLLMFIRRDMKEWKMEARRRDQQRREPKQQTQQQQQQHQQSTAAQQGSGRGQIQPYDGSDPSTSPVYPSSGSVYPGQNRNVEMAVMAERSPLVASAPPRSPVLPSSSIPPVPLTFPSAPPVYPSAANVPVPPPPYEPPSYGYAWDANYSAMGDAGSGSGNGDVNYAAQAGNAYGPLPVGLQLPAAESATYCSLPNTINTDAEQTLQYGFANPDMSNPHTTPAYAVAASPSLAIPSSSSSLYDIHKENETPLHTDGTVAAVHAHAHPSALPPSSASSSSSYASSSSSSSGVDVDALHLAQRRAAEFRLMERLAEKLALGSVAEAEKFARAYQYTMEDIRKIVETNSNNGQAEGEGEGEKQNEGGTE